MLPSHWVKIGLMLLAFVLATPHLGTLHASSEGGHGGDSKKSEKKSEKKGEGKDAGKPENGAIVKNIGDAVMAVFRQPVYALRAIVRAQRALAMPPRATSPVGATVSAHVTLCARLRRVMAT